MIITNYFTRVKVSNVMTCAHFGVDISRDINSGGVTSWGFPCANFGVDISRDRLWWGYKLGFPLYFVYGPHGLL